VVEESTIVEPEARMNLLALSCRAPAAVNIY
jgi:hypothetical protein